MKRTLNFTGRKALGRENVSLRLIRPDRGPPSFTASFSGLAELGLPSTAAIRVLPYAGSSSMRFDFGTVGLPLFPDDTVLVDLDAGATVLFDVRIIDESDAVGRILASARQLRPGSDDDDADRKSLLPVETADLGELLWKLDAPEGAAPRLQLNSRIPGAIGRLRTDPLMQGCILPVAIGTLVDRILDPESADTEDLEWVQDWRVWIGDVTGQLVEEIADPVARAEASQSICAAFARDMKFATQCAAANDIDPELVSDD
jgi:hypothetical protein